MTGLYQPGAEIAAASSTAMFSTASTVPVPVTAMIVTFIAGDRPIEVRFNGDLAHSSATNHAVVSITVDDIVRAHPSTLGIGNDIWHTVSRAVRVSGLTPGSYHTARILLSTYAPGGYARAAGDPTNPMTLEVVSL